MLSPASSHLTRTFAVVLLLTPAVMAAVGPAGRGGGESSLPLEPALQAAGVMHCFTESWEVACQAMDLGFYISFSGILTFKTAQDLREVAALVPMDRLLIETDSPYLAPPPHRGRRNEPAYTALTAAIGAKAFGMSAEDFAAATTANFDRLFAKAAAWRPENEAAR